MPSPEPEVIRSMERPVVEQVPWGWRHIAHPAPEVLEIHLMPMSDCGCHAFDTQCACAPRPDPDQPGFFIHHAFDGREAYEHGCRKPH